jgi:Two component regulator propeller./Bacterial regulatory helix-turn-helix proteins, AraC family./Y_Y_Y domain.
MWFGTIEGLDRYDGVEIRPYSQKFPEAVENVYAISEDAERQLWVGTATGLFFRNKNSDRFERVPIISENLNIRCLVFLSDTSLCVGTTQGLFLVNPRTKKTQRVLFSDDILSKENYITGIFPDNHGNCWLATHSGLFRYSPETKKNEAFFNSSFPQDGFNSFTSICNVGNKIYLGTSFMGIVEFDLSTKNFTSDLNIDNKIVLTISTDNKEHLFVGTDGGGLKIINVRTREIENITNNEENPVSISSNSIYSFFLDKNDRYWIGTYSGGVNYSRSFVRNFKLHPLTTKYSEVNKSIRSFYFANDGAQYFGTRNGFVTIKKNSDTKFFQVSSANTSGLRSNIILAVYPYKGDILLGTYGGGISMFSPNDQQIKPFHGHPAFENGNAYAFETDKSGNLWIATFTGIYRYSADKKQIFNYNKQNTDLNSDEIFELTFDSKGRLWVGTMTGFSVFEVKDDKLLKIKLPDIKGNIVKVNYIYEDLAGNLWICTERGGLFMLDQDLTQVKTFKETDGLSDNSVCAIIESNTGEYWISTLKGFCKYSTKNKRFTRFSLSDGLPSLVFTPSACFLSPDGTLYFGNEKGLVLFNPTELEGSLKSDDIRLTDFYLFGKAVEPGPKSVLKQRIEETDLIHLSNWSSSIGFRFVSLNYINPTDNYYEYKLEGLDKEWRNNYNKNVVFYEKLGPGNYTFKVRNANDSDENSPYIASVNIQIHRSLLTSPFFYGFILLVIAVGVFLLWRYIIWLKKKSEMQPEPVKIERYKGIKLPEIQSNAIINEMKRVMNEKKPYLNSEFKLADLATEINCSLHEISQVLNQDLNQSFPDFVNKYRVDEVKRRLEDKDYDRFTFFAIAQQCGFNSKTSFYRIFKNETGKTPADYVKDLNKE